MTITSEDCLHDDLEAADVERLMPIKMQLFEKFHAMWYSLCSLKTFGCPWKTVMCPGEINEQVLKMIIGYNYHTLLTITRTLVPCQDDRIPDLHKDLILA